jgi:hypothetical protein
LLGGAGIYSVARAHRAYPIQCASDNPAPSRDAVEETICLSTEEYQRNKRRDNYTIRIVYGVLIITLAAIAYEWLAG